MTELGDFRFVAIAFTDARHVAGFGAACQRLSVSSQIWCRQPSGRLSPLSSRITLNFPRVDLARPQCLAPRA
jgi:hypothetical protein